MFQKDYIMRMIEQLTIAFAALLGSKSQTKIEEFHEMVNEALHDITGMSEDTLLRLSHKDLIRIMSGGTEINTEKCLALAEMFKLKAEVTKNDSAKSLDLYLKSFNIFVEVIVSQGINVQNKYLTIKEIIEVLKQYKVPKESNLLLFKYYDFTGQYDQAENVLFKMISIDNMDDMVDEGFAFYERLKTMTLMELEDGNLPLDEVIEGLEVYLHLVNFRTL